MEELPMSRIHTIRWTIPRTALAVVLLAVVASLTTGCGDRCEPCDTKEIVDMEAAFLEAVAAKDTERFRTFWAEDAVILQPNKPMVEGRDAIVEAWKVVLDNPDIELTWKPARIEVSQSCDVGFTYGSYEMIVRSGEGEPVAEVGKYTTIWVRDAEGAWKILLDTGSSDGPPSGEES
jgi:uncharacterized protein (TIGR02246 family)